MLLILYMNTFKQDALVFRNTFLQCMLLSSLYLLDDIPWSRKIKNFKAACPKRDVICCKNIMYMVHITQRFANISIPSLTWVQRKIGSKSQMKVSVKRAHLKWFYNSAIFTTFMATVCINLFLQSYFLLPFFNVI